MYLLGLDIGSSSIKAAIVEARTGVTKSLAQSPDTEMTIVSLHPGWAEQSPSIWWNQVVLAVRKAIKQSNVPADQIQSIGIAYQMHGLVLVDKDYQVLRDAIIWCDSRAVGIGESSEKRLGKEYCLKHMLNTPGNFTASKLKWVKDNEGDIYDKTYKAMLPGDYIGMKLTGKVSTTISGLSEGIMWNFQKHEPAYDLFKDMGLRTDLIPDLVETCGDQGSLQIQAANELGLSQGIPITYRAGDQPNNALSLGVLKPGEAAATGGTSGVLYGVVDQPIFDPEKRINGFAHVNHHKESPRIGLLLCINGAGIQYSWIKKNIALEGMVYDDMERRMGDIPIGSDGLMIFPYGNGAERMFDNRALGAQISNLQFNKHHRGYMYRASLEGIAFSFVYGFQVLKDLGLTPNVIKVGNDNLFRSKTFSTTIANLIETPIEIIDTTGAIGAARAGGVGLGIYSSLEEATGLNKKIRTYAPEKNIEPYAIAYRKWEEGLQKLLH